MNEDPTRDELIEAALELVVYSRGDGLMEVKSPAARRFFDARFAYLHAHQAPAPPPVLTEERVQDIETAVDSIHARLARLESHRAPEDVVRGVNAEKFADTYFTDGDYMRFSRAEFVSILEDFIDQAARKTR